MKTKHAASIRYGITAAFSYLYRMYMLDNSTAATAIIWEMDSAPYIARRAFYRTLKRHA